MAIREPVTPEPIQLELDELLEILRVMWPDRYHAGRLMHVHTNAVRLRSGAIANVRVLIQQIAPPPGGKA